MTQETLSLSGDVKTERPSIATYSSMKSIPASAHASISDSLMAREASEMSVSPAQNFLNPSPVPGPFDGEPYSGVGAGEFLRNPCGDRFDRR